MPKTKKKFIDRKRAVKFNLVHRSQRDPLVADETAPQRVLVPVNASLPNNSKKDQPDLTPEQRRQEQQKYGIFFDDDYNYLQHLKDTKEVTMLLAPKTTHKRKEKSKAINSTVESTTEKLNLPSSVFASQVEEDVGLLNKAASQGLCLELDSEVVAALDEDFDFDDPDNQLEDNFIELAMAEGLEDEECSSDGDGNSSDQAFASDLDSDDDDTDGSEDEARPRMQFGRDRFSDEETKSRFTQCSMSSSVIRRNEGLTLLDARFEKMLAEYDAAEMDALDSEEIEGQLPETGKRLLQEAFEEFERSKLKYRLDNDEEVVRITNERLQEIAEESTDDEMVTITVEPKPEWDCKSILSTYSNLYNHPKLIEEPKRTKIKINPKTGIPVDVLGRDGKLTIKSLAKFDAINAQTDIQSDGGAKTHAESVQSMLSVLSIRPKDENAAEKRTRKKLLREYRRERRIEKKANTEAFKEEKKRQEKTLVNNAINLKGKRIS